MQKKIRTISQIMKIADQEKNRVLLEGSRVVNIVEDEEGEEQKQHSSVLLRDDENTPVKKKARTVSSPARPAGTAVKGSASPALGSQQSSFHGLSSSANSIDFNYILMGHPQKLQLSGVTSSLSLQRLAVCCFQIYGTNIHIKHQTRPYPTVSPLTVFDKDGLILRAILF